MKQKRNVSLVNNSEFESLMLRFEPHVGKRFAVAVSGGIDSMALAFLLHSWASHKGKKLVALIVDHGLRKESAKEAVSVSKTLDKLGIQNEVLKWTGKKPESAVQEIAREKRYELLIGWCKKNKISTLFLAHHLGDQVETFFQRLIRGSGLRGLACISDVSERHGVALVRPLLAIPKERLEQTLIENEIKWFEDETNSTDKYQRNRIRKVVENLEPEGFTQGRLSGTISALSGANQALDHYAKSAFNDCVDGESLNIEKLALYPSETIRRVIAKILQEVGNGEEIRREKLEPFIKWVLSEDGKSRTLAGAIAQKKKGLLIFSKETGRRN